jgi:hypothetical protein
MRGPQEIRYGKVTPLNDIMKQDNEELKPA